MATTKEDQPGKSASRPITYVVRGALVTAVYREDHLQTLLGQGWERSSLAAYLAHQRRLSAVQPIQRSELHGK